METPPEHPEPSPQAPNGRRGPPLVLLGGLAALVAGGAIAWALVGGGSGSTPPPPASEGGLIIDSSSADETGKMDPGKPLRCFVQGQFVGELSLTACAQRNGVATDALDVGIDDTGALAAAEQAGQVLTPLPPQDVAAADTGADSSAASDEADTPPTAAASAQACWRHGGGRWRKLSDSGDINSCVQTLFAGRCEKAGQALYGRYGSQTLRLVTGRVEVSDDNRTFRMLAPQGPDCAIPPVG